MLFMSMHQSNGHPPSSHLLTLHCHFYQPPRENPWTDEIDREPSAAPFNNWNERINEECYRANAFARIFQDDGKVVGIQNNYAFISFNFGPTLLSWIRQHAPDVYTRIQQGDRESLLRLGHGNAIAQGYNHIIMPLASRRDKVTQTRWAIDDFRFHYGRDPEAMWLPETAVDTETLDVLAEHGLKFVILAPNQAARVRPLAGGDWEDVRGARIDPSQAYLVKLPGGRSIAAFFYDGPISHDISFGDVLMSSANFVNRLRGCIDPQRPHSQLIHLASDGETFGHHKRYAERTLAYALSELAPEAGFEIINYATYLERYPPQVEAEIVENTAWSCAHGVGRWSHNCGCHTGGQPGWHQQWRAPLRTALDNLRATLDTAYMQHSAELFTDPWAVRDDFGAVLPHRHDTAYVREFLDRAAGRNLTDAEATRALVLLEMQRQAMMMYASCGWFFNDISGLETAQVLKYAAHGIDLLTRLGHGDPTHHFIRDLAQAPSNVPAMRHGARVYQTQVLPTRIGPEKVAASYALSAVIAPLPLRTHLHAHTVRQVEGHTHQMEDIRLVCGSLNLTSDFTHGETRWVYAALYLGGYNLQASVVRCGDPQLCRTVCDEIERLLHHRNLSDILSAMRLLVHPNVLSLAELPPSDRRRLLTEIDKTLLDELGSSYERIYAEHFGTLQAFRTAQMAVPEELRLAAEYTLSHRLMRAAQRLAESPGPDAVNAARQIVELAGNDGLMLDVIPARQVIEQAVTERMAALSRNGGPDVFDIGQICRVLEAAHELHFGLQLGHAQDYLISLIEDNPQLLQNSILLPLFNQLADLLGVSPQAWAVEA